MNELITDYDRDLLPEAEDYETSWCCGAEIEWAIKDRIQYYYCMDCGNYLEQNGGIYYE